MKYIIATGECIPVTQMVEYIKMRPDIYYLIEIYKEITIITNDKDGKFNEKVKDLPYNIMDYDEAVKLNITEEDSLIVYNTGFMKMGGVYKHYYIKNLQFIDKFTDEQMWTYIFDITPGFRLYRMFFQMRKEYGESHKELIDNVEKKLNKCGYFSGNLYNEEKVRYILNKLHKVHVEKYFYKPLIGMVRKIIKYTEPMKECVYDSIYYGTTRGGARNGFIEKFYGNIQGKHLLIGGWDKIIENDSIEFKTKMKHTELYDFIKNSVVSVMTGDKNYYDNSIHHRLIELSLGGTLILVEQQYDTKYKIFGEINGDWYIENKEELEYLIKYYKERPDQRLEDIQKQRKILEEQFKTNPL